MSWNSNNTMGSKVTERGFTLVNDGRTVPGVYWSPVGVEADRLVLLGHGGTAHKKIDYIDQIARGLCAAGIASMAIDGPGHGERPGAEQWGDDDFAERWESDGGTDAMVSDWKAALDFIEDEEDVRVTGWLGFSMGTMMGLPVCVADERISVAVLGLMGTWGPNGKDLRRLAPELSIPVRFVVQWDDEVVPRDRCLELYDLLGSERKTLHANPGEHRAIPNFEIAECIEYLDRRLAKLV